MQQNKSKIMMLYPGSFGDVVLEGVLVGVVLALFVFLVAGILFSTLSMDWLLVLLGLLVTLIFVGMGWLIAVPVWRKYTMNDLLRLDTARGLLLHGRWRWGWQAQREYPLSMFAAVAAEKVRDDYRGYYGRLWLVSADGQNDLVLEANFLPHKGSLHKLDGIQNYIAQATGLAKRPVINTVIRAEAETAANPTLLQPLQVKAMPVWRQAVNLAAAGLWTWLALWIETEKLGERIVKSSATFPYRILFSLGSL